MEPLKIPQMSKHEYDDLIRRQYLSRIAFFGGDHPYIAPFLYVFDGKFLYFLSTKYGRKMTYLGNNPNVSVEIEEYAQDLSSFSFVTLRGRIEEVRNPLQEKLIRTEFVAMIRKKKLSSHVLSALGHSPGDSVEALATGNRSAVWKLAGVTEIVALKNG